MKKNKVSCLELDGEEVLVNSRVICLYKVSKYNMLSSRAIIKLWCILARGHLWAEISISISALRLKPRITLDFVILRVALNSYMHTDFSYLKDVFKFFTTLCISEIMCGYGSRNEWIVNAVFRVLIFTINF